MTARARYSPLRGIRPAFCAALLALVALLSACVAGCGGGGTTGPDPAAIAAALTAEGWTQFEAGAFSTAAAKFRGAIGALSTYADAHNGLGWSLAFLDSLDAARASFTSAIGSGLASADPRAGRAIVLAEIPTANLRAAIDDAGVALALAPQFIFAHDTSVSWLDLRLLRAQAYFEIDSLDSAAAEVVLLGGVAPNPASPAYADSLLAVIERLGGAAPPPALAQAARPRLDTTRAAR